VLKDRLGGEFRSSGDVGSKYQAADETGRAALAAYSGLTNAAESGVHPLCPPGGPRDFWDGGGREGGCTGGRDGGSKERDACREGGAGAGRQRFRERGAQAGAPVRG
jgi:hypothetical protein